MFKKKNGACSYRFRLHTEEESTENYGKIVWGKMYSYRPWPALMFHGPTFDLQMPQLGKTWVYWLGENKISIIPAIKTVPFVSNYEVNYKQKSPALSVYRLGVLEAINICAERLTKKMLNEKEKLQWASDGFPVKNSRRLLSGGSLPELVVGHLERFRPKKVSQLIPTTKTANELLHPILKRSRSDPQPNDIIKRVMPDKVTHPITQRLRSDTVTQSNAEISMPDKVTQPNTKRITPDKVTQPNAKRLIQDKVTQPNTKRITPDKVTQPNVKRLIPDKVTQPNTKRITPDKVTQPNAKRLIPDKVTQPNTKILMPDKVTQPNAKRLIPDKVTQPNTKRITPDKVTQPNAKRLIPDKVTQPNTKILMPDKMTQLNAVRLMPAKVTQPNARRLRSDKRLMPDKVTQSKAERLMPDKLTQPNTKRLMLGKVTQSNAKRLMPDKVTQLNTKRLMLGKLTQSNAERLMPDKLTQPNTKRLMLGKVTQPNAKRLMSDKVTQPIAKRLMLDKVAQSNAKRLMPDKVTQPNAKRLMLDKVAQSNAKRLMPDKVTPPNAKRLMPDKVTQPNAERLMLDKVAQSNAKILMPDKVTQPNTKRLMPDKVNPPNARRLISDKVTKPNSVRLKPAKVTHPNARSFRSDKVLQSTTERILPDKLPPQTPKVLSIENSKGGDGCVDSGTGEKSQGNEESEDETKNSQDRAVVFTAVKEGIKKLEDICISCCKETGLGGYHPIFKGGLCTGCKDHFMENFFIVGDDGHKNYCTVCGDGGNLLVCDTKSCGLVYCQICIECMVKEGAVQSIDSLDEWHCFLCSMHSPERRGLLEVRPNWKDNLTQFFSIGYPIQIPPKPAERKPIRVLELYGGVGTGRYILDKLGFEIGSYFCCQFNVDCINLPALNQENVTHLGEATTLNWQKIFEVGQIDLFIGGITINNNDKKDWTENTSFKLMCTFFRILKTVQTNSPNVFYLFDGEADSETGMKPGLRKEFLTYFECQPVKLQVKTVSSLRSSGDKFKYFWANIPEIYSPLPNGYIPVMDTVMETVEEMVYFLNAYTEMKNVCGSKCQTVLGNSWNVPLIENMLFPLRDYFTHRTDQF